ncbi:MAG: hypothetical protein ACRC7O_14400, partial [Fimbriiglobus sp.]
MTTRSAGPTTARREVYRGRVRFGTGDTGYLTDPPGGPLDGFFATAAGRRVLGRLEGRAFDEADAVVEIRIERDDDSARQVDPSALNG